MPRLTLDNWIFQNQLHNDIVKPYLNIADICNLRMTSRFFYNDKTIKALLIDKLKKQKIQQTISFTSIVNYLPFSLFLKGDGTLLGSVNVPLCLLSADERARQKNTKLYQIPRFSNIKAVACLYDHLLLLSNDQKVYYIHYKDENTKNLEERNVLIEDVKKIATNQGNAYFLKTDGTVYVYGINNFGNLGLGHKEDQRDPVPIPDLKGVKEMAVGGFHALFLTEEGKVFATGRNERGQLGNGNRRDQSSLGEMSSLPISTIKQIAAGEHSSFLLTEAGEVYVCGSSNTREFGTYDSADVILTPTKRPAYTNIRQIISEDGKTFFIKTDGKVLACGQNIYGELGKKPFLMCNQLISFPIPVPTLKEVCDISCLDKSTVFLQEDGKVFICGTVGEQWKDILGINADSVIPPTLIPETKAISEKLNMLLAAEKPTHTARKKACVIT